MKRAEAAAKAIAHALSGSRVVGVLALTDQRARVLKETVVQMAMLTGVGLIDEPSRRRVRFSNGSQIQFYSSEAPDRLRGPEFELAWVDEVAAWRRDDGKVCPNCKSPDHFKPIDHRGHFIEYRCEGLNGCGHEWTGGPIALKILRYCLRRGELLESFGN